MKIDRSQLAEVCKRYGVFVVGLPPEINGAALLWALAGNESSFGQNVVSRHEPEYCSQMAWHKYFTPDAKEAWKLRPGKYANDPRQPELHRDFGCLACSSLTPWQIMAVHAIGYTPLELLNDLEKGAEAVVSFLNRRIAALHSKTLADVAYLWNGGGVSDQYITDLKSNYADGIPS